MTEQELQTTSSAKGTHTQPSTALKARALGVFKRGKKLQNGVAFRYITPLRYRQASGGKLVKPDPAHCKSMKDSRQNLTLPEIIRVGHRFAVYHH